MNSERDVCFVISDMSTIEIVDHFEVNKAEKLGHGTYGSVYKAIDIEDGKVVAAKEAWILDHDDPEEMERVQREVDIHGQLPPHDNIVTFISSKKLNNLWIFTEYCELGDRMKYCKKHSLAPAMKLDIMIQVIKGIRHLHHLDPPVAHRDIKPHNILITNINEKITAKLCDLGIAKATETENNAIKGFVTQIGSENFMAPEQFELRDTGKKTFDKSVDIFSAGLLIYVVMEAEDKQDLVPPSSKMCCCIDI